MMFVYFMDVNLIHLLIYFIHLFHFISYYFILFMYFRHGCYCNIIDNILCLKRLKKHKCTITSVPDKITCTTTFSAYRRLSIIWQ